MAMRMSLCMCRAEDNLPGLVLLGLRGRLARVGAASTRRGGGSRSRGGGRRRGVGGFLSSGVTVVGIPCRHEGLVIGAAGGANGAGGLEVGY